MAEESSIIHLMDKKNENGGMVNAMDSEFTLLLMGLDMKANTGMMKDMAMVYNFEVMEI